MSIFSSPEDWKAPQWHADYGDPCVEIERLRSLAIAIRNAMPEVKFTLEVPEPGIVELTAILTNGSPAKLLSVSSTRSRESDRYAIFLYPDSPEEIEEYRDSVDDVVSFLNCHADGCIDTTL